MCGNERTRVSALSNILLGARGIKKNKMKSTGRRPTTTTRATSNVKNCVAFRPTQVHRAEKIGNHRSPRCCWAVQLCTCASIYLPTHHHRRAVFFSKGFFCNCFQGILKRRKDQRKISIRCGPCARHVSDPTPDLFFRGVGGPYMYSACVWIDDDIKGLDESIIHSSSFFLDIPLPTGSSVDGGGWGATTGTYCVCDVICRHHWIREIWRDESNRIDREEAVTIKKKKKKTAVVHILTHAKG